MFCQNCGAELIDGRCPHGCNSPGSNLQDKKNIGLCFLSFLMPTIGITLWIVWNDLFPIKAKACGHAAIARYVIAFISAIILILFYGLAVKSLVELTGDPSAYIDSGLMM